MSTKPRFSRSFLRLRIPSQIYFSNWLGQTYFVSYQGKLKFFNASAQRAPEAIIFICEKRRKIE